MLDAASPSDAGNTDNVTLRNHSNTVMLSSEGVRGEGGKGSRAGAGAGIVYRSGPSRELILSTGKLPQSQGRGGSKSVSACCDGVDTVDEGGRAITATRTVSLPTRYSAAHHPSLAISSSSPPPPPSSSSSSSGDVHHHHHHQHPHHHRHHHHHSSMYRSTESVPGTWRDSLTGSYIPPHPNQQPG